MCGVFFFFFFFELQKPERDEWGSGIEALECALQLEKTVNQSLLDLHKVSSDHNDPHVSIKSLLDHCTPERREIVSPSMSHFSLRGHLSQILKIEISVKFLKILKHLKHTHWLYIWT